MLLPPLFYGLVLVNARDAAGLVFSAVVAGAGLFAFTIHTVFLLRGRDEFRSAVSIGILVLTLAVSLAMAAILVLL